MKILLATKLPQFLKSKWVDQQTEELATYGEIVTPLLKGQRQYFWWKALTALGHEVKVLRYDDPTPYSASVSRLIWFEENLKIPGSTRLRAAVAKREWHWIIQQLIQTAAMFKPDTILISEPIKGLNKQSLDALRKVTDAKIAFLIDTSPIVSVPLSFAKLASYFDIIICNDYYHTFQWQELDAKRVVALPISACDPEHDHPYGLSPEEEKRFKCDICFVGAVSPIHEYDHRLHYLESLVEYNLAIWTKDRDAVLNRPKLKKFYRGNAYGIDMVKAVSAAKIAVNIHPIFMQFGGNQRTFETPCIGTFQLIDRYDPDWFEEGKEIVSFKSPDDLREKVHYYLKHNEEREAIARAGQRRAITEHTYLHRMSQMLNIIVDAS